MDDYIDRFSLLPDELLTKIVGKLPRKDAIRTSILAKRWRYAFFYIKGIRMAGDSVNNRTFLEFVRRRLQLVIEITGSVDIFDIKTLGFVNQEILTTWVELCFKNRVKKFSIEFNTTRGVIIPPSFFNPNTSLETFDLTSPCILKPSPLASFRALKSINLKRVVLTDEISVENMFLQCPVLSDLGMVECEFRDINCLRVNCKSLEYLQFVDNEPISLLLRTENLKFLGFEGYIMGLSASDMIFIDEAMLDVWFLDETETEMSLKNEIASLFENVRNARILRVGTSSLEVLDMGGISFDKLEELQVNGNRHWEAVLRLMGRAPRLQKLNLPYGFHNELDVHVSVDFFLPKSARFSWFKTLKIVEIINVIDEDEELEFLLYLLTNCTLLEKMFLTPKSSSYLRRIRDILGEYIDTG